MAMRLLLLLSLLVVSQSVSVPKKQRVSLLRTQRLLNMTHAIRNQACISQCNGQEKETCIASCSRRNDDEEPTDDEGDVAYKVCMAQYDGYKDSATFKEFYQYQTAVCKCKASGKDADECEEEAAKSLVCALFPPIYFHRTSSQKRNSHSGHSNITASSRSHALANEEEEEETMYMCAYGSKEVTGLTFDGSKGSYGVAVQYAKTNFIKCTFKDIEGTALNFYGMDEDEEEKNVMNGFLGLDECTFTGCGTKLEHSTTAVGRQANEQGAVVQLFGQFMILHTTFENCGTQYSTALAIYAYADSSIANTKFIDCTSYAGAISGMVVNCTLTITHCHFKTSKAQYAPAALAVTLSISTEKKVSSSLTLSNIAFEGSALRESDTRRNADEEGIDAQVSKGGDDIPEGAVTISSVFTDKADGVSVTVGGEKQESVKKSENPAESADVDGSSGLSLPKLSEGGGDDDDKFPTWAIIVIVVGAVVIIAVVVAIIVVCVMRKKGGAKVSPDENGDKTFSSGTTSTPPAESTEEENTETQ